MTGWTRWRKSISGGRGKYDGKICLFYVCISRAGNILLYQIRYMKALVLTMLFYGIMLASDYLSLVVIGAVFPGRFWDFSDVFIFYGMRIFCTALAAISFITIFSIISITYETDWAALIGYYLIHSITEREIKLREHAVFREKVKNETAMYRSVSENLEKQTKRTHECKNQLAAISALVEQGAYQELRTYYRKN